LANLTLQVLTIKKFIVQYSTLTEAALWDTFKSGDDGAFNFMYSLFAADLYQYGLHLCNNMQLVEDSLHDLFVKIFNKRNQLGATTSIKFYLMRSLRREIADASKKGIKYAGKDLQENNDYDFLFEQTVETVIEKKQTSDALSATMLKEVNALPKKQREIIYLIFYNSLSYDDVAAMLNLSVRTVYNQVYNALQRLREINKVFEKFLAA
jgi:RNA polymerase sigma factor (sigma-70 family)